MELEPSILPRLGDPSHHREESSELRRRPSENNFVKYPEHRHVPPGRQWGQAKVTQRCSLSHPQLAEEAVLHVVNLLEHRGRRVIHCRRGALEVGEDLRFVQVHQLWSGEELPGTQELAEAPTSFSRNHPACRVHIKLRVEEYTKDFEILAGEEGPVHRVEGLLRWIEYHSIGPTPFVEIMLRLVLVSTDADFARLEDLAGVEVIGEDRLLKAQVVDRVPGVRVEDVPEGRSENRPLEYAVRKPLPLRAPVAHDYL